MSARTPGKFGLLPVEHDERDLLFAEFRESEEIEVPDTFDCTGGVEAFFMFGNGPEDPEPKGLPADFEGAGDCFWAGEAEQFRMFSSYGVGTPDVFTTLGVLGGYSDCTGYRLGDESTDQGTEPREGLKYLQKTGLIDGAGKVHKVGLYVAGQAQDWQEMLEIAYICDGAGLGFEVAGAQQQQFANEEAWKLTPHEQIEGGHWVPVTRCVSADVIEIATWARGDQKVERTWFEKRNNAVFGVFSEESLKTGKNPRGLDMAGVLARAKQLGLEVVQP
jgi:hypothetical protein